MSNIIAKNYQFLICGDSKIECTYNDGNTIKKGFYTFRCKKWDCPKCRKYKAYLVRQKIDSNFSNKQCYMLTLTYTRKLNPEQTWKLLGPTWNRLRTFMTKKIGKFSYCRIVEPHSDGQYPHLHIIIDRYIPMSLALSHLQKQGFGWVCHSQRISSAGASAYVTKYLTKVKWSESANLLRKLTNTRMVTLSRDCGALVQKAQNWAIDTIDLRILQFKELESEVKNFFKQIKVKIDELIITEQKIEGIGSFCPV